MEVYGNSPQLIAGIEAPGLTRLMDMSCTTQVWEKLPRPKDKAVTVKALVEQQRFAGPGRDVPIRQTSQGPLRAGIWAVPARVALSAGTTRGQKLLVVRQEADGRTTKHRNR